MLVTIGILYEVYEEDSSSIGSVVHNKKVEIIIDPMQIKGNLYVTANLKVLYLKVYKEVFRILVNIEQQIIN